MTLSVAVVLHQGITTLDAVGPAEVLRFVPGAELILVAPEAGPVATDNPAVVLTATASLTEVTNPDVVVVPGGPGTRGALDGPVVPWLADVHPRTTWTTSVCSGSLLLAAAGVLGDGPATSHFAVADFLPMLGVAFSDERVVVDRERHVVTAGGVSSGIDMALTLVGELCDPLTAQAIQLIIEYDPHPPHDTGSLAGASPEVVRRAIELGVPHGAIPEEWAAAHG
ncbi:DJ-1/PfpI family protein [Nocardioides sp. SYSU D00038]|uniref:DJ-1/PfpI family protein n=1 Tax=Nocardioides sp. SYSU D00038 TaxID=2812554 RepID=UPI0019671A37|nr:DJ-1/PfpI family protein [Nocardioides sp. SYSU D00038]